jgi:starvation-inducible DNA-binding protein
MLIDDLKTLYGSSFVYFAKSFGFHHNVEGPNFPQYHKFLGKIYEDVYDSLDKIAEYIRTLDAYTPGSLMRMLELSVIEEQIKIPRAELMMQELLEDNERMIEILNKCFSAAESENKQGIADFIAGRLDSHEKWGWMLRSTLNKSRA